MTNATNILALILTGLVGITQFGYALEYDRYLLVFIFLSCFFTFSKNKNIFVLFLILGVELSCEELIWQYSESDYYLKLPLYAWGFFGCFLTRDILIGKAGMVAIIAIFICEIYWRLSGYSNIPDLGWSAFILGQVLVVHEVVFMRPHVTKKLIPKWKSTRFCIADGHIMDIYKVRAILELINIFEYLCRHLFGTQLTIIYTIYPYVAHILTLATIWVVFKELIDILKRQFFPA